MYVVVADVMPSIAYYSKVASEEGGSMQGPKHSDGPLATPPMIQRPWVWFFLLVAAIGTGLFLTGSSPTSTNNIAQSSFNRPNTSPPVQSLTLRGADSIYDNTAHDALLEDVLNENTQLRAEVPHARMPVSGLVVTVRDANTLTPF